MKKIWNGGKAVTTSLTIQIFFLFLSILLIQSLIIVRYANKKASEDIAAKVDQYMSTYSETLSAELDGMIEEFNRNAKIILGNELVQNAIQRRYEPGYTIVQEVEDNETIQYIMFSFTALLDDTQMILADRDGGIFLKPDGTYKGNVSNIFENSYLMDKKELLDIGDYVVVPACNSNFYDYNNEPVYMLVRSLKNINDGKIIAYMATLFPAKNVNRLLNTAVTGISGVEIHLLDDRKNIFASTDPEMIGAVLEKSSAEEFKEISRPFTENGWELLLRIPRSYISDNFVSSWNEAFPLILVIIVVFGLLWCLFIYSMIIVPMKKLNNYMKQVELGQWNIRIREKAHSNEIARVYDGFDEMVKEIARLTKKNLQEQIMFKDAQMEALRYQINPHFLFNTLQTIEAIAEVYAVPEIQMISKSMGNMFRYNIRGFETVTLNEELEMIDSFMQIEKIRFGEEFTYEIDVSEEERTCNILKFILQPIVENCIQHGLEGNHKWIKIVSASDETTLTIQVLNSGRAMENEKMQNINELLDRARTSSDVNWISNRIGILNVHRRLITRFGEEYGVRFLYSDERGTCVQLTMPKGYGKNSI